jgi:membrane glycosyltransferase/SAM-dependent methyltransferase
MMARLPLARIWHSLGTAVIGTGLVMALWGGLDLPATHSVLAALVLGLFAVNAIWLSGTALTAVLGIGPAPVVPALPAKGTAPGPCAVLWLICGEDPVALAGRIDGFLRGLRATGQDGDCRIFVLSDTQGASALAHESAVLASVMPLIDYRNRPQAKGRKPGNLRDWMATHGARFETMLVLDADSGFSPARLAAMRAQMAAEPGLGLLQAAIRLRPGVSRFAELQRLSGRLCGPVFARGVARLSGDAGNYWGHNALIRTAAFGAVADLPHLRGRPPFGGPILSHDFIEAAFLRRVGWTVRIDPDSRGSFEDAPGTIATHLRRDRRWAQGNLQHLRLIGAAGLHPASRLHLLAGIQSYMSAPIWLALVLLFGSGAVHVTQIAVWPLAGTLVLLAVPKLAGVWAQGARGGKWRRRVIWRAFGEELALSTLLAPVALIRRTGSVLAVLAGHDSGWVPSGTASRRTAGTGWPEMVAGLLILLAVTLPQGLIGTGTAALAAGLMVLPIALPLLAAPWLTGWFDAPRPPRSRDRIAAYYDASTKRFLKAGGSGVALAIHRPLWAPGLHTAEQAAAHVNTLVAQATEAALGRQPERVRDLGCGVGGTLFHLADLWPETEFTGMTLSAEQARLAKVLAQARGQTDRCRVLRLDFSLPTTLPRADLVVAIESHVHAPSAQAFLVTARAHLAPGGVLIIVDDMLVRPAASLDRRGRTLIEAFQRGWRLGHVTPVRCPDEGLIQAAQIMGYTLRAEADLSSLLRLDRPRDRALRAVGPLANALGLGRWPLFANMIGGNALTQAHRKGIMCYRMVVLQYDRAALAVPTEHRPQGKSAA